MSFIKISLLLDASWGPRVGEAIQQTAKDLMEGEGLPVSKEKNLIFDFMDERVTFTFFHILSGLLFYLT